MKTHQPKGDVSQRLWNQYLSTRSIADRNALIEHYQRIPARIAAKFMAQAPKSVTYQDIVSSANLGLMEAIERYRPAQNRSFNNYATHRVHGAICDAARNIDHLSRHVRRQLRMLDNVRTMFKSRTGRDPSEEELANAMRLSPPAARRVFRNTSRQKNLSLNMIIGENEQGESVFIEHFIDQKHAVRPEVSFDDRDAFTTLICQLPRKMRVILFLYYFENLTMKEIGAAVGMSEPRVSQLHAHALQILRSQLTSNAEAN